MKFRELVKQSYEDLKNLTVTWYNVIAFSNDCYCLKRRYNTNYRYSSWFIRWRLLFKTPRRKKVNKRIPSV